MEPFHAINFRPPANNQSLEYSSFIQNHFKNWQEDLKLPENAFPPIEFPDLDLTIQEGITQSCPITTFSTVSGKQFVKEKGTDILGLVIAGHPSIESSKHMPSKIQDLLDQYPSIKEEPSKLLLLHNIQHNEGLFEWLVLQFSIWLT